MIAWLVAAMLWLAPRHDRTELERLAAAINRAVEARGPLHGMTARRSAALMLAVAYRESSLTIAAKGRGNDCGAWQHVTPNRAECDRLRTDADHAADVAWIDLDRSVRACPAEPLGVYAMGRCGTRHGRWVSQDRVQIARKAEGVVERPETKEQR